MSEGNFEESLEAEKSNPELSDVENESDEELQVYAEDSFRDLNIQYVEEFRGESEDKETKWEGLGEYGEAKDYFIYAGEGGELPPFWGPYEGSEHSAQSPAPSEVEETEEEKELKREREGLIENIHNKIMERLTLRRRNGFLLKKLVELYKKRRMEGAFKEDPKGLDLDSKYLKRLHVFKEVKQAQESEIEELTANMQQYETDTQNLEKELNEKQKNYVTRAKEVSLNLILSKTGKKINEKTVDRLLRRQLLKYEEKGKRKLQYIKIKNAIEESEKNLKEMQYFDNGLHISDYEQMKIDNQNYTDKIEEKEEELTSLRAKTQGIIENLAHVKEKIYAIEEDFELMEEKVYDVEQKLTQTREKLTKARKKRDFLREEFSRLKTVSGLLTRNALLRDFERAIAEAGNLQKTLAQVKRAMSERNKQEAELSKVITSASALGLSATSILPKKTSKLGVNTSSKRNIFGDE